MFKKNKIKEFFQGKFLSSKEIKLAEEDLKIAHRSFDEENYREAADYYGDYSKINAEKLLMRAKQFIKKSKNIIFKKII